MNKLLVITGPTATGKTALGIELAKKYQGEIISVDSRQVYKGNDIETGKDRSFLQWGIDLKNPGEEFSASDFVNYATGKIKEITTRGHLPIIVGGTGLYIKELLNPSETLHISPNKVLREKLEKLSVMELQKLITVKMNNSDWNNPRRLIRAIETTNKRTILSKDRPLYESLVIVLSAPREVLYQKIVARRASHPDLVKFEFSYAKRQLTYLKKYFFTAHWFDVDVTGYEEEIDAIVKAWLATATGKNLPTT